MAPYWRLVQVARKETVFASAISYWSLEIRWSRRSEVCEVLRTALPFRDRLVSAGQRCPLSVYRSVYFNTWETTLTRGA